MELLNSDKREEILGKIPEEIRKFWDKLLGDKTLYIRKSLVLPFNEDFVIYKQRVLINPSRITVPTYLARGSLLKNDYGIKYLLLGEYYDEVVFLKLIKLKAFW